MRLIIVVCALVLASCGPRPASETPAPESPLAPPPALADMSPRDALIDCAGAIAAEGGLDPIADPSTGSAAENTYFTVLALMDKEPGLEGAAGREAARIARDAWMAKPAEQRTARAVECMARFAG